MKKEPADKFMGRYRHRFGCVVVGPVLIFKTNFIIINGLDPIV